MIAFEYAPLGQSGWQIRLATLLPGAFEDDLHINLVHSSLSPPPSTSSSTSTKTENSDGEQDKAQDYADSRFTALSYVWGTTENPKHISVQTESGTPGSLAVTQNLEEALRYLRYPQQPRVFWVDAICVNQADLDERSRQVAFMGRLYNKARDVVVWLGPEKDDGEFALKVLKTCGDHLSIDWTDKKLTVLEHSQDPSGNEVDDALPELMRTNHLNQRETTALFHLMNREWFERLWVRQEVLTDTPTSFYLGNVAFAREPLMAGIFMMHYLNVWFDLRVTDTYKFMNRRQLLCNLVVSIAGSRTLDCLRYDLTGLRWGQSVDAIYASINLLVEGERSLKIVPDYNLPVATVFQNVAVELLQYTEKLTLLDTCELGSKVLPDLPSWVPDWSSQIKINRFDDYWSASAFISAIWSLKDDNTLRAAGIRKATVETVHDLVTYPQNNESIFLGIMEHMQQLLPDDLSAGYIGGRDLCDAYAQTFAAGCCAERYAHGADTATFADIKKFISDLKAISRTDNITTFLMTATSPELIVYLRIVMVVFRGRSFITTQEGYIGLAPQDTKAGDVVTVILGCKLPVILRPVESVQPQPDDSTVTNKYSPGEKWQVVGCCFMAGLMTGEAIYGDVPDYLSPTTRMLKPNVQLLGLKDTRTGEITSDPISVLAHFGIMPATMLHDPPRVHVTMETLINKGIAVEMLDII